MNSTNYKDNSSNINSYYLYIYSIIDNIMYEDSEKTCIDAIKLFLNNLETSNLKELRYFISTIDIKKLNFGSDLSDIEKKNKCLIGIIDNVMSSKSQRKK